MDVVFGKGTEKDYDEAFYWIKKITDRHYVINGVDNHGYGGIYGVYADFISGSWYLMGLFYGNGYHVKQDLATAHYWISMSAKEGSYWPAMDVLANVYEKGIGVPQDYAEANRWRIKAEEARKKQE